MRRLFLILCLLLVVTALGSRALSAQSKLDASILSYDGKDFVRTETTLMNNGQAAIGTKLDPDSAAYKALVEKSLTPDLRPFLVKTTKPITHRSLVQTANRPVPCL